MSKGTEGERIKEAIKSILKSRGYRYADLADALKVSLPTIRRMLTKDDLSIDRLSAIASWLGMSFFELMEVSRHNVAEFSYLTVEQEDFFSLYPSHYTYLRYLASRLTPADIQSKCGIRQESTGRYIRDLEKLGLIERLADKSTRLTIPWPANWRFPGPLQERYALSTYYKAVDYLTSHTVKQFASGGGHDDFFFMLDSLSLQQSSYDEYLRELKDLFKKYNAIGKLEGRTLPREKLRICSALLGLDRFDPLTATMGDVKDL